MLVLLSGSAQAGRWLAGGSFGIAIGETDMDALNEELLSRNINAVATSADVKRTAQQLYVGYDFLPNWGVELGYVDLGDVEASINGTIQGLTDFLDVAEDIYPQTAEGWRLSGVYRYPVSGKLQLNGKAGIYQWATDYTLDFGTIPRDISEDGTGFSIGLGLEAGQWIMRSGFVGLVNWDLYQVDGESINVIALGVAYRFQ